jgi:chorismate-pyruvate lyase
MLKEVEFSQTAPASGTRPDVSALARVLPVIGGTVTEVLEHHLGEPLRATAIDQRTRMCEQPLPILGLDRGALILERRVMLRGATTSMPVLYAESLIAVDRLDQPVRHQLLATDQPIGRVIRDNRVEIFREAPSCKRVWARHIAASFGMPPASRLLSRTYRMWNRGNPIMLVSEWFPC